MSVKMLAISVVGALGLAGCAEDAASSVANKPRATARPSDRPAGTERSEPDLRGLALSYRELAGGHRFVDESDLVGVVIDWTVSAGITATLSCINDGTVSMYLSNGGGVIGAGDHESVRQAATAVMREAVRLRTLFAPARDVALPPVGVMRFTLVLRSGLVTADGDVEELRVGRGPLAQLGNKAQALLTAIRLQTPT